MNVFLLCFLVVGKSFSPTMVNYTKVDTIAVMLGDIFIEWVENVTEVK